MLFKQHSKPDQPVRRQEITEAINSTTLNKTSNLSSYVIKQVWSPCLAAFVWSGSDFC